MTSLWYSKCFWNKLVLLAWTRFCSMLMIAPLHSRHCLLQSIFVGAAAARCATVGCPDSPWDQGLRATIAFSPKIWATTVGLHVLYVLCRRGGREASIGRNPPLPAYSGAEQPSLTCFSTGSSLDISLPDWNSWSKKDPLSVAAKLRGNSNLENCWKSLYF